MFGAALPEPHRHDRHVRPGRGEQRGERQQRHEAYYRSPRQAVRSGTPRAADLCEPYPEAVASTPFGGSPIPRCWPSLRGDLRPAALVLTLDVDEEVGQRWDVHLIGQL